jgi:phosphomannomutase
MCITHEINIYDRNPVGFKYQSKDMRKHPEKVIVGIEGNSGGFTVSSFSHEKDGCLAAALAIRMMAEMGNFAESINRLRAKYVRRYTREVSISTPDLPTREDRRDVINSLKKRFKAGQSFCSKKILEVVTVDGIKLNLAGDSSLLLRASGTEPKFRVVSETKAEIEIQQMIEAAKRMLMSPSST